MPEGVPKLQVRNFLARNYGGAQRYSNLGELVDDVRRRHRGNSSKLIFVDATAVDVPMTHLHLEVNGNTPYSIATANKNPVALSHYAVFQQLTEDPTRYGYRCSVMAGADVIDFLRNRRYIGDALRVVEGCLSGTLGYICSELETGRKFSDILREAKEVQKYTEPDPRDDLNGLDVARKIIVLARTAGYDVGLEDVKREPFIPDNYFVAGESIESFMERIKELDPVFEAKVAEAREQGMVLRYMARMEVTAGSQKVEVSLREVPKDSDLGNLKGTLNQTLIFTNVYSRSPYGIKAAGAGLDVTAANIATDLLYLPGGKRSPILAR